MQPHGILLPPPIYLCHPRHAVSLSPSDNIVADYIITVGAWEDLGLFITSVISKPFIPPGFSKASHCQNRLSYILNPGLIGW